MANLKQPRTRHLCIKPDAMHSLYTYYTHTHTHIHTPTSTTYIFPPSSGNSKKRKAKTRRSQRRERLDAPFNLLRTSACVSPTKYFDFLRRPLFISFSSFLHHFCSNSKFLYCHLFLLTSYVLALA